MTIPWGLVTFLVGIVYGLAMPGRQSKFGLFVNGVLIGLIVAIVLLILGAMYNTNPIGLGYGFLDVIVAAAVLSLLFVLGAWLGDILEGLTHRHRYA
jgi:hypothetical protein